MERRITDLLTLLTALKRGVENTFPAKVWVKAEISSVRVAANGHCYLELSQSIDSKLVAQVKATIWAGRFNVLGPCFRNVTGMPLQSGITVLLYVQVTYSQVYGLSLNVDDIDPAYTLGEKERLRRETLDRLSKEGLIDRQKSLPLPVLPRSVAVISAAGAAGYGDFTNHLAENPYGFRFRVELFPATMQGTSCPDSIISAMEDILLSDNPFDIVLILRGGGSDLDLSCYDDYSLCAAIARLPLPVFTAIGHERDTHIADTVACRSVKTPTALADALIEWYAGEDARLGSFATRIKLALGAKIAAMTGRVDALEARMRTALRTKIAAMTGRVDALEARIRTALRTKIAAMTGRIDALRTRIISALRTKTALAEARLNLLETKIHASDPRKIIERGYILALDAAGHTLKTALSSRPGDTISLMFHDGTVRGTVDSVTPNDREAGTQAETQTQPENRTH